MNEWYAVAAETRVALRKADAGDKELWRARLSKLEELVAYGLVEARVFKHRLVGLTRRITRRRYAT